jgi:predicted DNA-binding transcriptional regulator AlpA
MPRTRTTSPTATVEPQAAPQPGIDVHLLLWGWPEILKSLPVARRTIEKAISDGTFPKPAFHIGRRPFWRPSDIRGWVEGT